MYKKVLVCIAVLAVVFSAAFFAAEGVHINLQENKVEGIRPTQSYAYIRSVLGEAKVSEKYAYPLQSGEVSYGTRKIWADELFLLVGYFNEDDSLYGYVLISQSEKFRPANDFCKLQKTNFTDAHNKSGCYIDTACGHFCSNVQCASYYIELYDFGRSPFLYGLAATDLGVGFEAKDFIGINDLPQYQIIETPDTENPATNQAYEEYRKLRPNAMLLFNNKSEIDYIAFFKEITDGKLAITYNDLSRVY